jgi:predicted nuclease of predicted toxin-antitoxin system
MAQGHDAKHVAELGLDRAADGEILLRARQDGCTVITADLDYPRLIAQVGASDPGLILFRDGNWRDDDVVSRMREIMRSLPPDDLTHSILVVEHDRVRRRRLPIQS